MHEDYQSLSSLENLPPCLLGAEEVGAEVITLEGLDVGAKNDPPCCLH